MELDTKLVSYGIKYRQSMGPRKAVDVATGNPVPGLQEQYEDLEAQ